MNVFIVPSKTFFKEFVESPRFNNLQDVLRFDASTFDKMPGLKGQFFRNPSPQELFEATVLGLVSPNNRVLTLVIQSTTMGPARCVVTIPEHDLTHGATLLPMTLHFARGETIAQDSPKNQ